MADIPVELEFSLDYVTDPLGAELEVVITNAPTQDTTDALLDSMEEALVGAQNNLIFQSVQTAHRQLDRYGTANDYTVQPIIDSFDGVDYRRGRASITAEWYWTHEAAKYMEFGTSDHTIEGQPLLVFEFDAQEYPYLDEMFPGGTAFLQEVSVSGLPESRFVRKSLQSLRREVGQV